MMNCQVQFDENTVCDRCGRFGAFVFENTKLCAECYELRGACCPEFGRDDFWAEQPATPDGDKHCD